VTTDQFVAPDTSTNDAGADVAETGPACDLTKPFGTPVALTGALNSSSDNQSIWFLPDLLTAYTTSDRPDANIAGSNIYSATRADVDAAFTTLIASASLNSVAQTPPGYGSTGAVLTADGLTVYFTTGHVSTYAAWTAARTLTTVDFDPPVLLPDPINIDAGGENFPSWVTPDGGTLYFVTTRTGRRDIYTATRAGGGGFNTPVALASVNSASVNTTGIVLSADELQAIITRGGGNPTLLFYASRATTSDGFSTPTPITELNAFAAATASWMSADGCSVYFDAEPDGSANYEIFVATRGK